jgi:hypothetical protein
MRKRRSTQGKTTTSAKPWFRHSCLDGGRSCSFAEPSSKPVTKREIRLRVVHGSAHVVAEESFKKVVRPERKIHDAGDEL